MDIRTLTFCSAVLFGASNLSGCATSAGGRDIAGTLSAQVAIVGEEGARFAAARDSLARERLLNLQLLEDSAFDTEYENGLDARSWEVVGAKFRLKLYREVLKATEEMRLRRQEESTRREQQAAEFAARKSAVRVRGGELTTAAKALAALAAERDASAQRKFLQSFVGGVLSDIAKDSVSAGDTAKKAKSLLDAAAKTLEAKAAEDKIVEAAREVSRQ